MQEQGRRKVVLTGQGHETTFALSGSGDGRRLEVQCREAEGGEWVGSFALTDLDASCQALLERIDALHQYIAERTEEVEVEDHCVRVSLNFLKQTRTIVLPLSEMVRCSAEAQRRQVDRLRQLEAQCLNLSGLLREDGRGEHPLKLTLPLLPQTVNLDSYKLTNFREVAPLPANHLRNLFRFTPPLQLPATGLLAFHLAITALLPHPHTSTASPEIEIGIRDENNECVLTRLVHGDAEEGRRMQAHDQLRVVVNMGLRAMAVVRNFGESETLMLNWSALRGKQFWVSLRLYRVAVKTDLFVEEPPLRWSDV